ncbi:hypothetical protein ACHAW6_003734 [Cyclotella cf. meneghiniana]
MLSLEVFTKLDIGMQCYTFQLEEYSQDLCAKPLLLENTNIAQSIMEVVLAGIDDADVYTDDVGVSPKLGNTISSYSATYYAACMRMASLFIHLIQMGHQGN